MQGICTNRRKERDTIPVNYLQEFLMNRKRLFFAASLLVLVSLSVYAQQGGYKGPVAGAISVEEAKIFGMILL